MRCAIIAWTRSCWPPRTDAPEITEIALFDEPLLAALPLNHRLAAAEAVSEEDLAEELLVLAEGHCLANQALAACGRQSSAPRSGFQGSMQAATLETLVNLVAAGYGATLHSGAGGRFPRPARHRAAATCRAALRAPFAWPAARASRARRRCARWKR